MPSQGFNNANNIYTIDVGSVNWANIANAVIDDNTYATVTTTSNNPSDILVWQTFGFTIPDDGTVASIDGIEVVMECNQSVAGQFADILVGYENPAGATTNLATGSTATFGTANTTVTYGGPTEKWGQTWTPARINDILTQVYLQVQKASGTTSRIFRVDYAYVKVYYTLTSGGGAVANNQLMMVGIG
jgi:hypothetical protein